MAYEGKAGVFPPVPRVFFAEKNFVEKTALPDSEVSLDSVRLEVWRPQGELWLGYLLEDLDAAGYHQKSALNKEELLATVGALARFHGAQ